MAVLCWRFVSGLLSKLLSGLDVIYELTNSASYELRVDLEDFDAATAYAKYRQDLCPFAFTLIRGGK